jgi:hypothetical protein
VIELCAVVHTDVWRNTHWTGDTGGRRRRHGVKKGPFPAGPHLARFVHERSRMVGEVLVRTQRSGYISSRRGDRTGGGPGLTCMLDCRC